MLDRLATLEGRVDELELAPVATGMPERMRAENDVEAVEARLVKLEDSIQAINAVSTNAEDLRIDELNRRMGMLSSGDEQGERMTADDARLKVLDPAASDAEKLDAWRALRDADSWGDDVVDEMVRVAQASTDADVRADIWRQADGKDRNARLVGPMIQALRSDPEAKVREEAAETLANYLTEPGVIPALEDAAQNDAKSDVRGQAQRSLRKR